MKKIAKGIVIATLALLAACGDDDDSSSKPTTTTSTTAATTTSTSTSEAPSGPQVQDAIGTVKAWLQAVADGDDATAVGMLSKRSLDKIGGASGYERMKIELAEGWGAWGRADGIELTARTLPFPKDVAVVILHGSVSQEGPPRESWNALPVVATDEGDRVEAFLDLGDVTVDPAEGSTIEPGDELQVTTTTSSDTYLIVDALDAVMPALRDVDGTGARWAHTLGPLEPGLHALTVVITGDGIVARRFEYTVAA